MEMRLIRFGRRLLQDTDGQILLFGVALAVTVLAFLLVIPNGTAVTTQKVRAQTAADAGAFTGSVWLARALNLNANMNIGIKSVYTWMTVLTMGEALAKALYSDSLDPSVRAMGQGITQALFGSPSPVTVHSVEYPGAIQKLDTTVQWLYTLQDDISENFHNVAAILGTEEACRNAGSYPSSQAAGGWAIVRTNDAVPLLVASAAGDSLMYADLLQVGGALERIPTNDTNIGPATGHIVIDQNSYEIKAYYGDSSRWYTLRQALIGKLIVHQWYDTFPNEPDSLHKIYSRNHFYRVVNDPQLESAVGKSWVGAGVKLWYIDSLRPKQPKWRVYGKHSYSVPHPGDTVWANQTHWQYSGPGGWGPLPPGDTADGAYPYLDSGYDIVASGAFYTDFYSGAESTTGYKGPRVRLRRVNPDRKFHTVAYVWRQGSSTAPYGLNAPMGGVLFPRSTIAAPSPMLSVARSEPFLAGSNPTEYQYFFAPAWDVKLTPLDSIGVTEITSDTAYSGRCRNSFDNLEDLRKYVLLP
jgi:hypothetical protein